MRKAQELPAYVRGMEGYAGAFPLVIMDVTRRVLTETSRSGEYKAPLNQFGRIRTLVDPDFKDVVRISRNSLWSHAFVDLDEEPFVYSQPDTKGRFIVVQALSMWTDDFASSGSRTTGTEAGNFLIAGPKWRGTAPPDVKETFRSTTRSAWILVQIASDGPDGPPDYPEVNALQTASRSHRSAPGAGRTRRPTTSRSTPPSTPRPRRRPAAADERHRVLRAARGVDGRQPAVPRRCTDPQEAEGDRGRAGPGLRCRQPRPEARRGGDGKPLDGENAYVIHFEKDGMFLSHSGVWSISAYREHFYVHNPIERYAVSSGMPLTYNADGSLDV